LRKSRVSNRRAAFVFRWILHDFIEDISLLIDSAPEITSLAIDGDHDLVEIPDIMAAGRLALQATGVVGAEFDRPASDRFVGDEQCRAQAAFPRPDAGSEETEIEPYGMGDDLRWETMTLVADRRSGHAAATTRQIAHGRLT